MLTYLALAIVLVVPTARLLLGWHQKRRPHIRRFAKLLESLTDPAVLRHSRSRIAVDKNLSLRDCPDIRAGWRLEDVCIHFEHGYLPFPDAHREAFDRYFRENFVKEGFHQNGDKLAVVGIEACFTDAPKLHVYVKQTKYSEVKYFNDLRSKDPSLLEALIVDCHDGQITFPNALGLAGLVVTADNQVLMVQRAHEMGWEAGLWGPSIDEAISKDDFMVPQVPATVAWARRHLDQELGIDGSDYEDRALRPLCLMLEGDKGNFMLVTEMRLKLTAKQLDDLLRSLARKDREHADWKLVPFHTLVNEFRNPTLPYQPKARFIMLIGLLKRYGAAGLAKRAFGRN
jgi:hypothetical protein